MCSCQIESLHQLVDEVFYQESRYCAELRLLPTDAKALEKYFKVSCVPMDNNICPDGKVWYTVRLLEL